MPRGGPSQPPSERDLLAERRARRAAESGETALLHRAEAAEATVRTLETHIASLQQRLREAEGDSRRTLALAERLERVEGALEAIRESHRRMAVTVGELRDVTLRLRAVADQAAPRTSTQAPADPRREEMAAALAAAVERLRARAEESAPDASAPTAPVPTASAPAVRASPVPGAKPKLHKHSMSLIGRLRAARKHRREGR